MKKIYYLAYFANPEIHKNRNYVLSAVNKITYICKALNHNSLDVEIISASGASKYEQGSRIEISKGVTLKTFTSLGRGAKPKRVISRAVFNVFMIIYILRKVKREDTLLAYHSLGYMSIIRLLKRVIGFRLVLEVEEIYSDVTGNTIKRKKELEFFKIADAYIFPTELLNKEINTEQKPFAIVYGTYQVEKNRRKTTQENKRMPGKKHLLYAGTLDLRKGGAISSVLTAAYLPAEYHIHILGFGTKEDEEILKKKIEEINKKNGATVSYDGVLNGEEYIRFVQNCDVGLSTQIPDAAFNNTSFPSKVLSYLANGLRVVTVRIPVLEQSAINSLLYYYDGNNPKSIAETVQKIDWNQEYDSRILIGDLNQRFIKEIDWLIKN